MLVLLTRSETDNLAAAQELESCGHRVASAPLIEIQPLQEATCRRGLRSLLGSTLPDAVICVSRNGVFWGLPILREEFPAVTDKVPWYTLGVATRDVLEGFGIQAHVPDLPSRSEEFLEMPELQRVSKKTLLYIAGEGGRPLIEEELGARGARVLRWDVYRRRPDLSAAKRFREFSEIPDVLTAMSGETLLALDQSLPARDICTWKKRRLLVPSDRVAAQADDLGFPDVVVVPVTGKHWPADYLCAQASL